MGGHRRHPVAIGEWTAAASFAQERLWFLQRMEPGGSTYNLVVDINLGCSIHLGALKLALDNVLCRHEPLRTTFVESDGRVLQRVHAPAPVELPVTDLSAMPRHRAALDAERIIAAEARQPFDLEAGPLLRPRLIRFVDDHRLSIVVHHVVFDQWSSDVLRAELLATYSALRAGLPPGLPRLRVQFADYAAWQRGWLTDQVMDEHLAYWRDQLAKGTTLDLPTDHRRPAVRGSTGTTIAFHIPADLGDRLRALAGRTRCTLFMVLLAGFQALLARHADQRDVAVGVPVSGRDHPDVEALIGFFVNTVVLRTDMSGNPTVVELLDRVRKVALEAHAHQAVPFEHLVQALRSDRDRGRNPLFDVMFNFRTARGPDSCGFGSATTKFDLTLDVIDAGRELRGEVEYSTELFDPPTMERLIGDYRTMLAELTAAPEQRLEDLVRRIDPLPAATRTGLGSKRLVAYVVPTDPGRPPSATELRAFLEAELPGQFVPAVFVTLEALPLNPSGKIDRRALPSPDGTAGNRGYGHQTLRTPTERALAEIWREVLHVDLIGADDAFFELGGHSLLATQVVARIRTRLGVDLPLVAVFDAPTVAGLAALVDSSIRAEPVPAIARATGDSPPMLSYAQERLWFLNQLDPGSPEYNTPIALRLRGPLDLDALGHALTEIVTRHEVLRTTIGADADGTVQVVHPPRPVDLPVRDLSGLPAAQAMAKARALVDAAASEPFDLFLDPPLRAHLVRLDVDDHVLGLNLYHIASDRWSEDILRYELAVLYAAFRDDEPAPLPPLPVQYRDYAAWQRQWLSGEAVEHQLRYWRAHLAGLPTLDLRTDRPRPPVRTAAGAVYEFTVPTQVSDGLRALGRQAGVTMFMVLLGALHTLLARYTGQHDIAIGTPIANRGHPDLESLIGFFLNTLVLRTDLSGDPTIAELLARERRVCLDAYAHQDLPFEHLIDALQPERDRSRPALVQVIFDFETTAVEAPPADLGGLGLSDFPVACATAKSDLRLVMTDSDKSLSGGLEYSTELFDEPTIARLVESFQTLLAEIAADPDRRLSEVPMLTPAQRERLVEWERGPHAPAVPGVFVHDLIAEHAVATPGATAVVADERELTYAELVNAADRLADRLRLVGAGRETIVGVCMEPGADLIVALLATWAAGAIYLPLDAEAPLPRLAFLIHDAPVGVLVSTTELAERLPDHAAPLILLDEPGTTSTARPGSTAVHPDNIAYLIYTSGSTGAPKGVALAHRGLTSLTEAQRLMFDVSPAERVLQFAPTSFDASIWEMVMALSAGATLAVAPPRHRRTPEDLGRYLSRHQVGVATLPPVELAILDPGQAATLRTVIAAGEQLPADVAARWRGPTRRLVNAYGPTETTVCASAGPVDAVGDRPPAIGTPIANTTCRVLDGQLRRVPVGVVGELFVGGPGLARGYVNRPALTAERFVADPFAEEGTRLYRTGDLVVRHDDGRLQFIGRTDDQVKIRGHRVEPGEIEATLATHPGVELAVVVVREDTPGERRLVAYVVPAQRDDPPVPGEMRVHLSARLPDYLVPSAFVTVASLPRTSSGKVDRHALPAPGQGCSDPVVVHDPPRTATEQVVADIWRDMLHLDRVGRGDDFFDLGGHSVLATRVVARVRAELEVDVPVATLFDAPTLAGWAALVEDLLIEDIERLPDHEVRRLLAADGNAS